MTMRGGKWWWVVAVGCGGLVVGLAWFLTTQGLDGADKWASVIAMFVGIAGCVLAAFLGRRPAPSQPDTPSAGSAAGDVHNQIKGGTFSGPVVQGRDIHGLVMPPQTPPPTAGPADDDTVR